MTTPRITSAITPSPAPTSAEACVARQEAEKLLEALRPSVVAMILGQKPEFHHVDHVQGDRVLQLVVSRLMMP